MDEFTKILALAFLALVVILLCYCRILRQRKEKVAGFLLVTGTVVENVENSRSFGDDGGPTFCPVVEYVVNRRKYEVTSKIGYGPKKAEGSPMKVLHHPTDPANAVVWNDYFLAGPYVLLGLVCVLTIMGSLLAYLILLPGK